MSKKTQTSLIIALVTTMIAAIACIITLILLSTPACASSSTLQPLVTPNPTQPPLLTPTYGPPASPTATYTPMPTPPPTNTPTTQPSTTEEPIWEKVITVFTGLATFLAALAVLISLYQTGLVRREMNASIILHVLRLMEDLRDKRARLYQSPPNYEDWNDEDIEAADDICIWLERIAYLAQTGLVDKEYLLKNYALVFSKCWQKVENLVMDEREEFGHPRTIEEGAYRRRHFESFARECREYMSRHFPRVRLQVDQSADDDDQS